MSACISLLSVALAVGGADTLSTGDSAVQRLPIMAVHDSRPPEAPALHVEVAESLVGSSDDFNNLLYLEPGVTRVPEAGSLLSVQGDGPYENRTLVRDVPLFASAHFSGQLFADRSIAPVGIPAEYLLLTDEISGRYGGASGSVVRYDPGFLSAPLAPNHPQLAIGYGTLGADLTFEVPFYRSGQRYQATYRASDRFSIWSEDTAYGRDNGPAVIGAGDASSYDDWQILGEQRIGRVRVEQLSFVSLDDYVHSMRVVDSGNGFVVREQRLPWQVHAVTIGDTAGERRWQVSAGGAQQYWFNGTRVGDTVPTVGVKCSNAVLTARLGEDLLRIPLELRLDGEYRDWNGQVMLSGQDWGASSANVDVALARWQQDGHVGVHAGSRCPLGQVVLGANVYGALYLPGPAVTADPGLWARFVMPRSDVQLNCGIVSAQPDIRGLPSESSSADLCRTYEANLTSATHPWRWLSLDCLAYCKWKDHMPVASDNAYVPVWDDQRGSMLAAGTSLTGDIRAGRHVRLWSQQTLGTTRMEHGSDRQPAPWDSRWTNKSVASCSMIRDHLSLYLIGFFADGQPYRAPVRDDSGQMVWGDVEGRTPTYNRIDTKLELRHTCDPRWHVLEYDVYVLLENVLNTVNVREYSWDSDLRPQPVYLQPREYHVGVRAHMRF